MKERTREKHASNDDQSHTGARDLRWNLIIVAALCVMTFAAYWPVHAAQFVNYDDEHYITRNARVQEGLNWDNIKWAFSTTHAANWHPLTWLSHMLDCQVFGMNAGSHHLVSVALHALNALLLFFTLMRMTGARWRSALVAVLFALHPLHVESVAWIAERKDLLSTLWGLVAIFCFARYVERPGLGRYVLVAGCFGLSLLCKPMLVTLPFLFLLLDVWPLKRVWARGDAGGLGATPAVGRAWDSSSSHLTSKPTLLLLEKLPLLAMSAASCVVTVVAQQHAGAIGNTDVIPFSTRLANAAHSYAMYIVQMIWPSNMAVLYPYPQGWPVWEVVGAFALIAGVTVITSVLRRERSWLLIGWLWFLGTLLPVIGLVQVGEQSRADRYTYFPLIGLFIMVVWSLPGAAAMAGKKPWLVQFQSVCAAIVLLVLGTLTWHQTSYWQNSRVLFEHTLAVTDNNATAHANLGMALVSENALDEAASHFRSAIQLESTYPEAHNGLGYVEAVKDNLDEAVRHYQDAVKYRPEFAEAHHGLAAALAKQKKFDEAIVQYREALRLNPELVNLHYDFGIALASKGITDEAIAQFQQAVKDNPSQGDAYDQLGLALTNRNRVAEAIDAFRKVVALQPEDAAIRNNLARLLLAKPDHSAADVKEAIKMAQRGCQLDGGKNPRLISTLAATFAAAGQIEMAIDAENMAMEKAQAIGDQGLIDVTHANLMLYQAIQRKNNSQTTAP